ncbi:Peroxisomal membrane protein import receptor PEX19 [Candida viswanathii]|uniref:Peroxisomal membrane protein import receptor PEX19 n=1 Tax=Candida viswanathii TaxID=5486 RepID=A0A367YK83_9ASCO|nr:Peroxisomal membrane protein import receptor PEX19 [Candida viswanathii]
MSSDKETKPTTAQEEPAKPVATAAAAAATTAADETTGDSPSTSSDNAGPAETKKEPITTNTNTNTAGKSTTNANDEDDLDDLDDLLDDFADDVLSKPPGASVASNDKQSTANNDTQRDPAAKPTDPLDADFQQSISELIKDLKIENPEAQKQFEELVKEFENNHRESVEAEEKKPGNFEYVMKETMERLKKLGNDIDAKFKNDPTGSNPEDLLTQLLAGMGGDGLGGGDMDMSKLLVDMLEQLSSKEVLYEPIKDLNTKFPDYLEKNKDTLDDFKLKNYTKQYEITNDIVSIFEHESYSDDNKDQRDQVNALLESLQELGQPPSELVGDAGDFLPGFGDAKGANGADAFGFNDKDLPPDFEKNLQEGCQQQ